MSFLKDLPAILAMMPIFAVVLIVMTYSGSRSSGKTVTSRRGHAVAPLPENNRSWTGTGGEAA